MISRNRVYIGAWIDCVDQTKQLFRLPKWPVHVPSDAARCLTSMRAYHNHSNRAKHVLTTNKYKCMCDVEHGCTETNEQSIDDWQCRQFHNVGHTLLHTQTLILYPWMTLPTVHHPSLVQVLFPGHPQHGIVTFRLNMLRAQKRPIHHRNVIVYFWKWKCLVAQYIQKIARENDSSHVDFVKEWLQHNANFKVAQRCQHGILFMIVLMIFKANENVEEVTDPFIARREMTNQTDWANNFTTNGEYVTKTLPTRTTEHWNPTLQHMHASCNVVQMQARPGSRVHHGKQKINCSQYREEPFIDPRHTCGNVMMGAFPNAHLQFLIKSVFLHSRKC